MMLAQMTHAHQAHAAMFSTAQGQDAHATLIQTAMTATYAQTMHAT